MGMMARAIGAAYGRARAARGVEGKRRQASPDASDDAEDGTAPGRTGFDDLVNGLNRLPRPLLAFGAIGLIAYAMTDPQAFANRMDGLKSAPEPLWWLLGAIVAFYFGARESHYLRHRDKGAAKAVPPPKQDGNAAVDAWRAGQE